jgi:hypothetical protein
MANTVLIEDQLLNANALLEVLKDSLGEEDYPRFYQVCLVQERIKQAVEDLNKNKVDSE